MAAAIGGLKSRSAARSEFLRRYAVLVADRDVAARRRCTSALEGAGFGLILAAADLETASTYLREHACDLMLIDPNVGADSVAVFDFIRAVGFSGGHVFRFSPRLGTPASNLSDRVNGLVKKDRSKIVREALKNAENKYLKKNEQRIARVLWERSEQGEDRKYHLTGTSDNYITVNTKSDIELYNKLSTVKIVETRKGFVFGEIVS